MAEVIVRKYDKKIYKRCIKCKSWKPRADILDDDGNIVEKHGFGTNSTTEDGLQTICQSCKGSANQESRNRNVAARLRHHIATRCLTQLGVCAPQGFTKDLESYLGYRIPRLVAALREDLVAREGEGRKLRDALDEGYHIDHIRPLSSFNVLVAPPYSSQDASDDGVMVDWDAFRQCWAIENLSAIPAAENLAKGAKF